MRARADVVIIGGGVAGCAIAYHLAQKGCNNVILLERHYLTSGATGTCPGGIRFQLATEIKVQLVKASAEILRHLRQEAQYHHDLELKWGGYLILAYSPEQLEILRKNVALQRSLGIGVNLITPEEAREIVPQLHTEGLWGAAFHGGDGQASPFHVTHAFAQAAQRRGVAICTNTVVTDIQTRGDRVTGVITDKGAIATSKVVNAAGLEANRIGTMVGVDIPLSAERLECCITEPVEPFIEPFVISFWPFFGCLQRPTGNLFLIGAASGLPEGLDAEPSCQFLLEVAPLLVRALPALRNASIIRQWVGLVPTSPDEHPILGPVPQVRGFYVVAGLSGQGFMLSPIIGKLMAEAILGEEPSIAIDKLDLGRFERGERIEPPFPLV
ncbi:MAG TPA: FAD-binding oxidoreductase [Dehalococcoidia bacterium]|nr:FAD-binding oxidoreductase [Dehalococcoidia bacterium]